MASVIVAIASLTFYPTPRQGLVHFYGGRQTNVIAMVGIRSFRGRAPYDAARGMGCARPN